MTNIREKLLPGELDKLDKEIDNFKSSQSVGSDSIKCYLVESGNRWDYEETITFTSPATTSGFTMLVRYTADHQNAPFAKLMTEVLINDTYTYKLASGFSGDLQYSEHGVWLNGNVPDRYGGYSPDGRANTFKEINWYNDLSTLISPTNVKIKFRVYSSDTGRLFATIDKYDSKIVVIS